MKRNIEFAKDLLEQSAETVKRRADSEKRILEEANKSAREVEIQYEKVTDMIRQGKAQYLYPQHPNKWLLENYNKFL